MILNYDQENAHHSEPHHPKVSVRGLASLLLAGMLLFAVSVAFTACQVEPTAKPEADEAASQQTSSLTIGELCGADTTGAECSSAKRFDARRGVWEAGSADEFEPGDEVLHDETLFKVEDDHVLVRQIEDAQRTDLELASQAWDRADDHRPPGADEIVYVVAEVGGHSLLRDVEDGERFAFQGRVYEAELGDGSMQVHHSGETVNRVAHTFRDRARTVVDLTVRDVASGEEGTLTATPDHPFYVVDRDEPVEMGELEPGQQLRGEGGAVLRVEAVAERADDVEVFNFEVEDVHNYHVAAEGFGGVGALVGNKAAFVRGWRGENVEIRGTKSSGRLRGYTEATSDMTGGLDAARSNFEEIAGRAPSVPDGATIDRFVGDQVEAVFRPDSRTGTPVVEIIDHSQEIHEKIHFNP